MLTSFWCTWCLHSPVRMHPSSTGTPRATGNQLASLHYRNKSTIARNHDLLATAWTSCVSFGILKRDVLKEQPVFCSRLAKADMTLTNWPQHVLAPIVATSSRHETGLI
ncbi:hypothetical protein N7G274_004846 [Stereocaulon virgatum]|uniref:Secreted protein n=1 Tax=Stereocaulon virgatum TaxID=373712 RepID=A0ABR4A8Z0_9LECA